MKLTRYRINKIVKKLAAKSRYRNHRFCPLNEASDILLLFDETDNSIIKPCVDTLSQMNKTVHACVCCSGKGKNSPLADPVCCMTINERLDTDNWYIPNKNVCHEMNQIHADILIDLTSKSISPINYLVLQHSAFFKVGIKQGDSDIYDLSIVPKGSESTKQLFDHILFYLRTIRSK